MAVGTKIYCHTKEDKFEIMKESDKRNRSRQANIDNLEERLNMQARGKWWLRIGGLLVIVMGIVSTASMVFELIELYATMRYKDFDMDFRTRVFIIYNISTIFIAILWGVGMIIVGWLGVKYCNNIQKSTICVVCGSIMTAIIVAAFIYGITSERLQTGGMQVTLRTVFGLTVFMGPVVYLCGAILNKKQQIKEHSIV